MEDRSTYGVPIQLTDSFFVFFFFAKQYLRGAPLVLELLLRKHFILLSPQYLREISVVFKIAGFHWFTVTFTMTTEPSSLL